MQPLTNLDFKKYDPPFPIRTDKRKKKTNQKEYWNISEVCEYLDISYPTFSRWWQSGVFKDVRTVCIGSKRKQLKADDVKRLYDSDIFAV